MRDHTLFSIPESFGSWIAVHMPALGDVRRIRFRSCRRIPFWWIPGNRSMAGLTLWNRIYVRDSHCPVDWGRRESVELLLHELTHVVQFRRHPFLFPLRYLIDHWRFGYWNNPAEVEARESAARLARAYLGEVARDCRGKNGRA